MNALIIFALLSAAPAMDKPAALQALTPTSGGDARVLVDGDPKTTWSPLGEAKDEGVLFRFEQPIDADAVNVTPCPGSSFSITLYANAAEVTTKKLGSEATRLPLKAEDLRSLFLRIDDAPSGKACLAEVSIERTRQPIKVVPPRTVNGKVTASSTLTPADAYHPSFLFDGRLDFGWVEGAKGKGEGESVTFTFDRPTTITGLELWNGYQRSDDHYAKNARAAQLSVTEDGGKPITLPVKDDRKPQLLKLPKATVTSLTLKIDKAYAGTKYEDLVLSELRFWDEQGPFSLTSDDAEQRRVALVSSVKTTAMEPVIDRHFSSVCPDEATRWVTLKFRSNHTFVWYDTAQGESSRDEVFDGAWVLNKPNEIELFGRRNVVEESFDPYEEGATTQQIKISGGKVKVTPLKDVPVEAFRAWYKKSGEAPKFGCLKVSGKDQDALFAAAREALIKKSAVMLEGTAVSGVVLPDL